MPSNGSGAAYPFGSPMPGANFGGTQQSVPSAAGGSTPAVGGQNNPFFFPITGGNQQPSSPSPYGGTPTNGLNIATQSGFNGAPAPGLLGQYGQAGGGSAYNAQNIDQTAFLNSMKHAGVGSGIAQLLWGFLQGGAGFSPEAAQAMIASLQPQQQQAEANLMEQFSSSGNRNGSPAAYGLASLDSQIQAQYANVFAQMYEQSVQNYMNVLLGGKGEPQQSGWQNFASAASGIGSILSGIGSITPKH